MTSIKDHAGMFRARIMSDEQRKRVLDNAYRVTKTLRGTQFDKVFISRDLTRAQRTVLYEKRPAKRTQNQVATNNNCLGPSAKDPTQATLASLTNAPQSTEPASQINTDVSQGNGAQLQSVRTACGETRSLSSFAIYLYHEVSTD